MHEKDTIQIFKTADELASFCRVEGLRHHVFIVGGRVLRSRFNGEKFVVIERRSPEEPRDADADALLALYSATV